MRWCHPNNVPDDFICVVQSDAFNIFVKYEDVKYSGDGVLEVEACFVKNTTYATKWKANKALKKFYVDALRSMIKNKS